MPTPPSSVPSQPRRFSVSPPGSTVSIRATIIGITAITSDAYPEATMVSAHVSRTLFADINRMPTSASCQAVRRETPRLMPRVTQ